MPAIPAIASARRALPTLATVALSVGVTLVVDDYLRARGAEAQEPPPAIAAKYATRLDQLDTEAIEGAYRDQIMHLFENWMRDPSGQPARAVTGARNARRAFVAAMIEIEKRQNLKPAGGAN
jgi:hypothetical protein